MKFNVGDRVKVIQAPKDFTSYLGMIGTVIETIFYCPTEPYEVKFDNVSLPNTLWSDSELKLVENKNPILSEEKEPEIRKFVIQKLYPLEDEFCLSDVREINLIEGETEILSCIKDTTLIIGFLKALDYLGITYEVETVRINRDY